jgi:hypothetical protein
MTPATWLLAAGGFRALRLRLGRRASCVDPLLIRLGDEEDDFPLAVEP